MNRIITLHKPDWRWMALLNVVLLLTGRLAGLALATKGWSPFGGNRAPVNLPAEQRVNQAVNLNTGFTAIAKAVTHAVVTVEISARVRPQQGPFFNFPFGDLFNWDLPDQGDPRQPRRTQRQLKSQPPQDGGRLQPTGLGSGVIVSPDGYILTNNHVVEGAGKVEVTFPDRRHFTARVVGSDAPSDIGILKIEARDLTSLPFGDSSKIEVGDVVLAIGNPLGVGQTVTMGIISAKGRSTSLSSANSGSGSYEDFLQTDAAINRGNSGGALVNLQGELIGIPSQIVSQTGGSIGIGFAIPTGLARNVMDQLLKSGKVRRGKLGVTLGLLTTELSAQFGYTGTQGAIVQDVEAGQAAARAGLKPGDIISEYQGQRIADSMQLRNLVAQTAPGTTVKFKVWRDGAERELTATLDEMMLARRDKGAIENGSGAAGNALSGVTVENLTTNMARQLNLPSGARGVAVYAVDNDSSAASAGLRSGDVIEGVNRQPVANVSEFNLAVQQAGKRNVLLRVRRAQQGAFFLVIPASE